MVDQKTRRQRVDQQLDAAFSALGDRTRRRIVEILREANELRVGDIAAAFSISLNAVSKHLKVLESAGLVRREVIGREHWIAVDFSGLAQPHAWLDAHRRFWSERLDALADLVETQEKE